MKHESAIDQATGRKFFLDQPEGWEGQLTFVLNLHGGGSVGAWQRSYFPAHDYADEYGLVVASPSCATREPMTHWTPEADDDHLRNLVTTVVERLGAGNIRAFWLAGHSQGGMTSFRLLADAFFADRVDGFLSLSGGRIGRAEVVADFGPPRTPEQRAAMAQMRSRRFQPPPVPDADFSFIFAVGEHEIVALPDTSPWAEKYGAGPRQRRPDIVDDQAGQIHDPRWGERSTPSWGRDPRPGTARMWVYPGARDGRVVADVVRLDKGHTEGLEPNVTRALVELMVAAPGGKIQSLASTGPAPGT